MVPMMPPISTVKVPTRKADWAPVIRRLKISLPKLSVPRKCSAPGSRKVCPRIILIGS